MTQAQHTPGPWMADFHNERRDGGRFVTMILAGNYLVPIAAVPSGVEGYGREEGRANAALVAAAPAMLAALELAEPFIRSGDVDTRGGKIELSRLANIMRAAIAAATGTPTGEGGHPIPASHSEREQATILAAVRMWQAASLQERAPFDDIATNAGLFSPLGAAGVDSLVARFGGEGGQ